MKFIAFDLETTGVDVETAEVVQAAAVEAHLQDNRLVVGDSSTQLFFVASIPEGATAVHGIRVKDVLDKPAFAACVCSLVKGLLAPDVVAVSFNGAGYDIPIIARYWHAVSKDATRDEYEQRLRLRHIDVMRLWWRVQRSKENPRAPWTAPGHAASHLTIRANMFAGSLTAAHGFFTGYDFDDAHDAGVDCRATLTVLSEILATGFTIEEAIEASNKPLPGDVDFAGKLKWHGDRVVLTIGKQAGSLIEQVDRGFLKWMLDKDFPADTKAIVREYLSSGKLPRRSET